MPPIPVLPITGFTILFALTDKDGELADGDPLVGEVAFEIGERRLDHRPHLLRGGDESSCEHTPLHLEFELEVCRGGRG